MQSALKPEVFRKLYRDFAEQNPKWNEIPSSTGDVYRVGRGERLHPGAAVLRRLLDGRRPDRGNPRRASARAFSATRVTTDHISPAGAIKANSPAGKYLQSRGVEPEDFNSYGSRRGNDRVMTRGTFANVRIKNLMVPGVEGGVTKHQPSGEQMSILRRGDEIRGSEARRSSFSPARNTAPARAATGRRKGTRLLGVKAVVAASFERIHRSNLVGHGRAAAAIRRRRERAVVRPGRHGNFQHYSASASRSSRGRT